MSTCEGCARPGHGPEACANTDVPICARMCTCRHGAGEPDPALYWVGGRSGATYWTETADQQPRTET
jgi:hypothetical protein